jgi:acyl dehydratase
MTSQSGRLALTHGQHLPPYRVVAHNASTQSENKIHDDDVAKQYGFAGGLVPGVTDYAYMTRPLIEAFGLAWLEHGRLSARFLKPIYEGEEVTVTAAVASFDDAGVSVDVSALNPAGEICASGTGGLPKVPPPAPGLDDVPVGPLFAGRPAASEEALAVGTVLGTVETAFGDEEYTRYLEDAREHLPLYEGPNAVAPSGYLIREANRVLVQNVRLGPWIHVSSEVQHHGLVHRGDRLSTRARVVDLFERGGHKFVDLDVLLVANGERPVMRVAHRAIWDVRKKA